MRKIRAGPLTNEAAPTETQRILSEHPPGWIGTISSGDRPPIAICVKKKFPKPRRNLLAPVHGLDDTLQKPGSDPFHVFIDENRWRGLSAGNASNGEVL